VPETMVLVLAGGGGERLSVLTYERAVSALPFGGKYRVIDFVLSNCSHSHLTVVGILTQHAPISLNDHIGAGRPWDLDRREGGVLILQPFTTRTHAGWYRGTADAIAQNWDVIEDHRPERILVLSGDQIYRMDYRSLMHTHEQQHAAVTLAVTRVPSSQTPRFGMTTIDRDGRVTELIEKPERAATPFASMGIYLFEYGALAEAMRPGPVNLVLDVLRPLVAAGERVMAHEFAGYWEDVGTIGSYYHSNLEMVAPEPRLALHDPRWPVLTRDEERPPVLLGAGAVVDRALIANGCRISGTVRRSVLFPGVVVESGAEVVDSVVMQDAKIGPGARLERALLDKFTRIGEGARVGSSTPAALQDHAWLEGLVLIGKDAIVAAHGRVEPPAVVGIGARVQPGSGGYVGPGTQVPSRVWYEDVV